MTTVRTIKLKRGGAAAQEPDPVADPMTMETAAAVAPQEAAPTPVPQPKAVTYSKVSSKSYLIYVIAAALTVIGIITILSLQYAETNYYKAAPSSWVGGAK